MPGSYNPGGNYNPGGMPGNYNPSGNYNPGGYPGNYNPGGMPGNYNPGGSYNQGNQGNMYNNQNSLGCASGPCFNGAVNNIDNYYLFNHLTKIRDSILYLSFILYVRCR